VNIRIVCIGNEILSGETLNTNLAFTGELLAQQGLNIQMEVCVPDEKNAVKDAVRKAMNPPACAITVGGLGPTEDDITRQAVAEVLERPLHLDTDTAERIKRFVHKQGFSVPDEAIIQQATVPQGAETLANENGTAPGLCMRHGKSVLFMLPGPPHEYRPMLRNGVMPRIRALIPTSTAMARLKICGTPESVVEATVQDVVGEWNEAHFAYCAKPEAVTLTITAPPDQNQRLESVLRRLRHAFGYNALPEACSGLPEYVGELLRKRHWTLATAESCTGGAIADAITAIPGASDWFMGAAVTYANEWKQAMLGVRTETLNTFGAVSEQTVQEMVLGLVQRYSVDAGIAVSGIAGPTGATPGKPVGTVCIATKTPTRGTVRTARFLGDRTTVRMRAAMSALNQLRLDLIEDDATTP
jgi:nicotinamide-nucleotide amidase